MSGQMDFYYMLLSPPCRSVLLTANAIGVKLNKKILNLVAGEHMKPEFVKINPEHTIPTLVDNGFALWESRAIMIYLVEKYGKTDSLYPKCPKKRAVINQRLFFDMGTLYTSFTDYYYPKLFGIGTFHSDNFARMETAFELLNTFLEGQKYAAGDTLTLADMALVTSVSAFDVAGFDISKYGTVDKWYKHVATVIPGYELNQEGMAEFKQYFK